jgi:hypothetical protein
MTKGECGVLAFDARRHGTNFSVMLYQCWRNYRKDNFNQSR